MPDDAAVRLPPLAGRQQESWRAFIELAPTLGDHCLLVGGQMVFLLETERGSRDTRPTDDVEIVIDLRVEPAGLARVHQTLLDAGFGQMLPSTDGIAHRYTRDDRCPGPGQARKPSTFGARHRPHDRGARRQSATRAQQRRERRAHRWLDRSRATSNLGRRARTTFDPVARRLASSHRLMWLRGEGDFGRSRPRRTRGLTRPSCVTRELGARGVE
jgi:hypothetical protein